MTGATASYGGNEGLSGGCEAMLATHRLLSSRRAQYARHYSISDLVTVYSLCMRGVDGKSRRSVLICQGRAGSGILLLKANMGQPCQKTNAGNKLLLCYVRKRSVRRQYLESADVVTENDEVSRGWTTTLVSASLGAPSAPLYKRYQIRRYIFDHVL